MDVARYSAIIFDLFGTLVPTYRHRQVLGEMAAELRLEPERFIRAFAEETRDARETGQVRLAANLRAICRSLGATAGEAAVARAVTIRRDFTLRSLSPRPGAIETLTRLRDRGLALALISDCCEIVSDVWESLPIASHFDASILSCRVGLRKPDRRIYELACESLGVTPSACLYVGDGGSHELSGARRAGLDAALLAVPEESGHDVYRPDAIEWQGRVIHSLADLRSA